MSTITVDPMKVADIVQSLRSLASLCSDYESLSLEFSESSGPQVDGLVAAAQAVGALAAKEHALIDAIADGIVYDMVALCNMDAAIAQALLEGLSGGGAS